MLSFWWLPHLFYLGVDGGLVGAPVSDEGAASVLGTPGDGLTAGVAGLTFTSFRMNLTGSCAHL